MFLFCKVPELGDLVNKPLTRRRDSGKLCDPAILGLFVAGSGCGKPRVAFWFICRLKGLFTAGKRINGLLSPVNPSRQFSCK